MNFPIEFRKKNKKPRRIFFFKLITTIRLYIYIYTVGKGKKRKNKKIHFLTGGL